MKVGTVSFSALKEHPWSADLALARQRLAPEIHSAEEVWRTTHGTQEAAVFALKQWLVSTARPGTHPFIPAEVRQEISEDMCRTPYETLCRVDPFLTYALLLEKKPRLIAYHEELCRQSQKEIDYWREGEHALTVPSSLGPSRPKP